MTSLLGGCHIVISLYFRIVNFCFIFFMRILFLSCKSSAVTSECSYHSLLGGRHIIIISLFLHWQCLFHYFTSLSGGCHVDFQQLRVFLPLFVLYFLKSVSVSYFSMCIWFLSCLQVMKDLTSFIFRCWLLCFVMPRQVTYILVTLGVFLHFIMSFI